MTHLRSSAFICGFIVFSLTLHADDFAIHDGDTVVFLGDSITAEGTYGKMIENYTLLRYPNRKVHFVNAGHGGDTAQGGLERLQRDVFDQGATLVTVAYGINDIGWGAKADAEHRQKYLDGIRGIVKACKAKHVRLFICSPAATAADPDKSADDFLTKMTREGMQIAKSEGEGAIDILGSMREVQRRIKEANAHETDEKKKETLHVGDGIHLNDLGEIAMGFAILKGLGAPRDVSAATIDTVPAKLGQPPEVSSNGCAVSDVKVSGGVLEFDRLDEGAPLNFGLFGVFKFRFIPIPDQLNRLMLTVKNLEPGKYSIEAGGRGLGTFDSKQLSDGINISSATADGWQPGGPWEAQAWQVNHLTESRYQLMLTYREREITKGLPLEKEIDAQRNKVNASIEELQRKTVQPVKNHFVIKIVSSK
jgi:lysophospholipase L1-like esterase